MNEREITIRVMVENTVNMGKLLGEHGLSYFIQIADKSFLFDVGQGMVLPHNARLMNVDLKNVDAVVLSHGHYDHTGGLKWFFENGLVPKVYAHPAALEMKYAERRTGEFDSIGVAVSVSETDVARLAERAVWTEKPTELEAGLWITGPIPKTVDYEKPSPRFRLDDNGKTRDDLIDDQSMFFQTGRGVVVLLGCAHSGVVNTLSYIRSLTGDAPFLHVMGGTHLVDASTERLQRTIEDLKCFNIERMSPCHCTGYAATQAIHRAFGERCVNCSAGSEFQFQALS